MGMGKGRFKLICILKNIFDITASKIFEIDMRNRSIYELVLFCDDIYIYFHCYTN